MLEKRELLAGEPLITEFLASNSNGLRDQFNRTSDWLEIRNPLSSNFDLSGYHLTDDTGDLTQWTFPTGTVLGGGGYMVVFASGDDVILPDQPMHTNFELDAGGGYLALVSPTGQILSQYDYPEQLTDTSYGIAVQSAVTPLINPSAIVRTHFPTNDGLGLGWTQNGFNDGNGNLWRQGITGVGYEADPPPPPYQGFMVRMVDTATGQIGTISQATSVINGTYAPGTYTIASDITKNYPTVNFGGGNNFAGDHILPNGETNGEAPGRSHYALRITANITIPVGTWTINVGSDDGFRLRIPGIQFITGSKYNQEFTSVPLPQSQQDINETLVYGTGRGHNQTGGAFTVTGAPLTTTITLDVFEGAGGDSAELSIASGQRGSFDTTNFAPLANALSGWTISSQDVAPRNNYSSLIGQNVLADMHNIRTGAYMRLPFTVSGASGFDTLRLRMKYDDGFVAYVNGTKVAERNAPASPVWNSAATDAHADEQALVFEDIDITLPPGLLINGNNVLAIHGLNDAADSPDFLIMPTLAVLSTVVQPGERYMTTPTPGGLNNNSNINGVVSDTSFNVDRGFYDAPFQLIIATNTPGATIRYTTNGTAPTDSNGTVYTGPITINKTTVVRAAAFRTGFISSDVDTQTYIFLDDVLTQSANGVAPNVGGIQWPQGPVNSQTLDWGMDPDIVNSPTWAPNIKNDLKAIPSISLVMSPDDLFNPSTGIIVNAGGDGRAWERPASVELIDPLGREEGFQVNAGVRIRGGFSVSGGNPKHSFRLFFRDEYGDSRLNYPLFPDDPTAATSFDSIDLRTMQNYSWAFGGDSNGIFIRDQLSRDMQLAMGQPGTRGRWYHLYIDGQYWGLFNTDERPEADFAASYYGGDEENYDVVKPACGGCNLFATDGDLNAWTQLYNLAASLGTIAGQIVVTYSGKTGNPAVGQTVTQLNSGASGTIAAIEGATGRITITVTNGVFTNNPADLIRVNLANYVTPDNTQAIRNPSNEIYWKMQGRNPDGTRNPEFPILLDMDNLIDYMLVILHGGNLDAPISNFISNTGQNNWFGSRPRSGEFGFRFYAHDSEHTILPFNGSSFDRTGPWPNPNSANNPWSLAQSNPQYIWQQLGGARTDIGSDEFRLKVADHLQQMFFNNGPLTSAQVLARFDKRVAELDRAVVGESARWGDAKVGVPYTRNTWLNAVANARSYSANRSNTVLNQLINDGQMPKLASGVLFNAPNFSQFGGNIGTNFNLTISNPNGVGGQIYYTLDGSDPRMPGGAISPTAVLYSGAIPLNRSVEVKARIRYMDGNRLVWSAVTAAKFRYNLSGLHITEIMYNPAAPPEGSPYTGDDFEYIELQNTGSLTLQLGGAHFDEGITFTFPSMALAPGQRTLVVKNRAAFESRYGLGLPIAGEYIGIGGGTLSNNGEDVNLRGPVGEQLIHFNYEDDWYAIVNGAGYSLVVRDPAAAQTIVPPANQNPLSIKGNWRPSNLAGGAPGAADPGINPEAIVINEVMSHSTSPTGDWIELKNLTNSPINIGGWFLSNDALNLKKYQIPAGTTVPNGVNGFIVFHAETSFGNAANPGVSVPFTLDEVNGSEIYLTNNDGSGNVAGYREFADFGASPPNVTFGRHIKSNLATDFTQLVSATMAANNSAPEIGPLIISEVNYNPTAGGQEFIEIENITDFPVQLWDPANPNNTWKVLSGVDFSFPTNVTIAGFGSIVLIPNTISIAAFRSTYNVPSEVQVFQYSGSLDNAGEDLKLAKPLPPVIGPSGPIVPYQLIDKVKYGDALPWPVPPDGDGPSLQRAQPLSYGNDPANWRTGPVNGNPGIVTAPQRRPVVEIGADATITQGVALVRNGSFSDVNSEQTFTGTVNWGDGTPTQPLTLNANKTFVLSHTYTQTGTFTITVTITDSFPESTTDTMQVIVTPSNAPDVNAGPDGASVEGDTFTSSGSFTDIDTGQNWTATVNWGDGSGTVPLALNPDKTFDLSHVFTTAGNYTVVATVRDNVNISDTDTFQVQVVANSLPTVSNVPDGIIPEDNNFTAAGSFSDPNGQQTWSATVNWGDGGPSEPLTLNQDKTFNLDHPYANPGTYNVTVTVTDSVNGSGVENFVISVRPAPRLGTGGDDVYTIRRDPTGQYIQFFENRTIAQGPSYFLAHSAMDDYIFNGVGSNDTLVIDLSNGNPLPPGNVNFNGGAHVAPGDLVLITGGNGNDEVHVLSTLVMIGSNWIDYASAERITFDGGGGNDTMFIDEGMSFSPAFNGGTGNDSVVVNGGTWRLTADALASTENLNLTVNADSTVIATATQHLASLTLNNNGRFTLGANGTRLLRTNGLTMHPSAILDLFDNNLIVQATPQTKSAVWTAVRGLLISGRNRGAWTGAPGIRSGTAGTNPLRSTGLAAVLNDRGDGTAIRGTFEGESVTPESIMIKYTYNGDANQNGTVDGDDYAAIDNGYALGLTGYQNGDFDYNGGVDADDFFLIDKAHFDQGAPLGGGSAAAPLAQEELAPVAEPTPAPVETEAGPVVSEEPQPVEKTASQPKSKRAREAVAAALPAKKKAKKNRHHRRNDLLETPIAAPLAKWRRD